MISSNIANDVREWVKSSQISFNVFKTKHFQGKIINNEVDLLRLSKKMKKLKEFAFDTETTGFRVKVAGNDRIVGIAISWGKRNNYYIPIYHLEYMDECVSEKLFVKYFKKVFERLDVVIVAHNGMFDFHVLENMGIKIRTKFLYDTMTACWMINENLNKNLEFVVNHYYGYDKYHFKDIIATVPGEVKKEYGYKTNQRVPCSLCEIPILGLYCMDDTYWAWKLYLDTMDAIADEEMENHFYKRYVDFFYVIFAMERRGVKVNIEALKVMQKKAEKELEKLQYQIYEIAGIEFNINSGQQVAELLFSYEKYNPVYEEIREYEFDSQGEPVLYKSGQRKGEHKYKTRNNKNKIVSQVFAGNKQILSMSFNFPVKNVTKSGAPSTDKEALEAILNKEYKKDKRKKEGQELVKLLLKYAKLEKRKGTYMDGMLKQIYQDGRLHTNYNITGTTSGRLSSNEPNLQNLRLTS